jgi:GT2 family glycosyltransferase
VLFQHNDFLPPGPLVAYLVRAAAARATLVTAPSHAVARELGGRVDVVHPGVEVSRFDAAASPAQPPEVLVLGALVPWKRPELAFEACALARRSVPDLRLRFVGGSLDGESQPCSIDVELVGPVGDVAPELARATCLLHCADREPFGLAVLEALAAGRPVVVPAAGGPEEIVDDSCAIRYRPGDARAAADALVRLVTDPELAAAMGAAGRRRASERFDAAASRRSWAEAVASVRRRRAVATPGSPRPLHSTSPLRSTPSTDSTPQLRMTLRLEIVTVTYNSASVIGGLLASVERHLPGVGVVVVDNASFDDTAALAEASPIARVIELGENVGFGRACNRGVAEVQAEVIALLNPDVELLDDSLGALADEALSRDRLLAPLVQRPDGSRQDSVHPAPGSAAELARALLPFTRLPARIAAPFAPWRSRSPRRVGWAIGCALVARTETLRALGPFDERIFLYGEDLELGLRAADAGIETWFWPSARVLHHGAHATGAAFGEEPVELLAHARRDVIGARRGPRQVLVDDVAQAVTFGTRITAKRALRHDATRERRQLGALRRARYFKQIDA